nr:isoprenylcysteine carboxylmethyltransferase family protein [Kibdelosporangium sp. MJ126-NF4]CEL22481.1 Putative protein-S-isoprenylcysteine methyltransferase [Kibdelosporangium sp. MJ126-NF4]CTQ89337.1 Putative protein-S-isoprenylcysteine methyltransferase [Kibdelosporangium sp. MJ126-NF4]
MMAALALVLLVIFLVGAFVLRVVAHRRMTGASGINGVLSGRPGSAVWWAGLALVVSMALSMAAPIAQLAGLDPLPALVAPPIQITGVVLAVLGFLGTVAAQHTMGPSWRVGVNPDEATGLVTQGAFTVVRNPIFATTVLCFTGLTLMAPNVIALVGFAGMLVSVELQVRVVEEPYLRRLHGDAYADYGSRVGRFVPGVGRFGNR